MDEITVFPGTYGGLFVDYVRFKRSLGYAIPTSYQYMLRMIARCIASGQPEVDIVSRASADV